MKVFTTVLKILAALAAIAGIVYFVATYGDKIVAWAKKMLGKYGYCCCCDEAEEAAAEEVIPEEVSEDEVTVQDFEG